VLGLNIAAELTTKGSEEVVMVPLNSLSSITESPSWVLIMKRASPSETGSKSLKLLLIVEYVKYSGGLLETSGGIRTPISLRLRPPPNATLKLVGLEIIPFVSGILAKLPVRVAPPKSLPVRM